MSPVLVVGESERETAPLLEIVSQAGLRGHSITGIEESLRPDHAPALVLWDSGEEAHVAMSVDRLGQRFPQVPVIVLTDRTNEMAMKMAVEAGVAGCLSRHRIESDLLRTVRTILEFGSASQANECDTTLDDWSMCYTIENNPELLPLVVGEIRRRMSNWPFRDPIELVRITVALSESLDNALYHGNLELSSDLRQGDGKAWRDESLRRRYLPPYCDRSIRIQGTIGSDQARFTIRDEGPGFDFGLQRDCTEEDNLERCSGRGLLLMRMYMDDVVYNSTGNEVTLVKRRPA